jgi:hypothetical protein
VWTFSPRQSSSYQNIECSLPHASFCGVGHHGFHPQEQHVTGGPINQCRGCGAGQRMDAFLRRRISILRNGHPNCQQDAGDQLVDVMVEPSPWAISKFISSAPVAMVLVVLFSTA